MIKKYPGWEQHRRRTGALNSMEILDLPLGKSENHCANGQPEQEEETEGGREEGGWRRGRAGGGKGGKEGERRGRQQPEPSGRPTGRHCKRHGAYMPLCTDVYQVVSCSTHRDESNEPP